MKISNPLQTLPLQTLGLAKRSSRLGVIALSLLIFGALTMSAATRKSTLYVATGTFGVAGTLYTFDLTTFLVTTVGPLKDAAGGTYAMAGMKYNPLNGILYGATSGKSPTNPLSLITINPATALVTLIGPFGGAVLTDIAIDPGTGIMYGVSGFNEKFYTVNLTTGLATQIGNTGIGFQNGGGLAANAAGVLYGVNNFSTYTYNKTTGAATFIGLNLLADFVRAADFDSRGTLYGLEGGGGIDNLHLRFLVTINLTTGIGVLVHSIPVDDLDGLAFIPAPR